MPAYPACLEVLIAEFCRLPGIGRKSAERLAFHALACSVDDVRALARALTDARETIVSCTRCHGIAEGDLCPVCLDPRRDETVLCVVEQARDVFALERDRVFPGRYHVLGGVISPLAGVGPADLNIDDLEPRIRTHGIREVILALNPSTEGETTSMYLASLLRATGTRITRIAYGLPVGGELEFSDPVTLARALEGRRDL